MPGRVVPSVRAYRFEWHDRLEIVIPSDPVLRSSALLVTFRTDELHQLDSGNTEIVIVQRGERVCLASRFSTDDSAVQADGVPISDGMGRMDPSALGQD